MTTLHIVLGVAWVAAAYRVALSLRHRPTMWRTSFTVGAVCAAAGTTLWVYREPLDRLSGVWNLTNLVCHLVLLVGIAATQVYVDTLWRRHVTRHRLGLQILGAGAVAAATTAAWIVAPIHDRPHPDLLPLADRPSVALYYLLFYGYLVWGLTRCATLCFSRAIHRGDPARTVGLLIIGSAHALGAIIIILWSVAIIVRFTTGHQVGHLSRTGDALLPAALLGFGLGILSLLVVPPAAAAWASHRRYQALRPLWDLLTQLRPEVRLPEIPSRGPLDRLRLRERRALIEIRDALRLLRLDLPAGASVDQLAHALRHYQPGDRSAAEVLPRCGNREDDVAQVLHLARAYAASPS